ncbi:MAG: triphosphoribosyl-dephospho-CoA synthase [Candidatus Aenigmarchaeota archaeon]|nr:triphosphoribosyl-dephospho-CoA synthase [Candidatus Aenigmarchaeota archaeon]
MRAAQLASALEICGWPKPGNVHRTAYFHDTKFEHFVAGSISIGPVVRSSTLKGIAAGLNKIKLSEIHLGKLINHAISDVKSWHKGGNTHLGTMLLFIPLAATAGMTFITHKKIDLVHLRKNFKKIMRATTYEDAVEVYDAIIRANPGGIGTLKDKSAPDLTDKKFKQKLVKSRLSLYDVMLVSSAWDTLAKELTTGLYITFSFGYPTYCDIYNRTNDVNLATVHTYLTLLSRFPDTFVARNVGLKFVSEIPEAVKIGMKEAKNVAIEAKKVLKLGGLTTNEGKKALFQLDKKLRAEGLNPGTTADLTAASLFIAILQGLRP